MFDSTDYQLYDSQLIQVLNCEKAGKPYKDNNGVEHQLFKCHVQFVVNNAKKFHDIYTTEQKKEGFYLPAIGTKNLYVQELDRENNKVIKYKPYALVKIGAFVHS